MSFNKFKSTTIYGDFNNKDLDANNTSKANGTFDRNVSIKGTLQSNDCSFNTISLNGDISCNSLTITPIEISYLKNVSSNIQTQINVISNNYIKNSALSNYVTNSSLTTQLNNYCLQTNYTTLKAQADATTLLSTNTQYITGFGLNFYGSVNVHGTLYVTVGSNTYFDVKTLLNNLPTTYVSITSYNSGISNINADLSNNYVKILFLLLII